MNVVITGASKGIGRAIATSFAANGSNLFLCARNDIPLYETVAELQAKYPESSIHAQVADMSKKEAAKKFGQWVIDKAKTIDVLVNNAGSFVPGSILSETDESLEHMINTNLYSVYFLTRTLLPPMIAAGQGHIINLCSIASLQAYPNGSSYGISKFALLGLTKNLREELKPHNIKVTAVHPGAVMTESWGDFDNSKQRIMEASDIATMIVAVTKLSPQAVVEDIIIRPQLGDL